MRSTCITEIARYFNSNEGTASTGLSNMLKIYWIYEKGCIAAVIRYVLTSRNHRKCTKIVHSSDEYTDNFLMENI